MSLSYTPKALHKHGFHIVDNLIRKQTDEITGNTTWSGIVPSGHILEYIILVNSTSNAAILSMGTSVGASDIFLSQTVSASGNTVMTIFKMFSTTSSQTLDLNDSGGLDTWNSSSLKVYFVMKKII